MAGRRKHIWFGPLACGLVVLTLSGPDGRTVGPFSARASGGVAEIRYPPPDGDGWTVHIQIPGQSPPIELSHGYVETTARRLTGARGGDVEGLRDEIWTRPRDFPGLYELWILASASVRASTPPAVSHPPIRRSISSPPPMTTQRGSCARSWIA